jgi:hypothetical protein
MAKGRAPHQAIGLQLSNLHGRSLPAGSDKTRELALTALICREECAWHRGRSSRELAS